MQRETDLNTAKIEIKEQDSSEQAIPSIWFLFLGREHVGVAMKRLPKGGIGLRLLMWWDGAL